MAEKCTNTSSPVERWINPYPFAPLNHFTVPFSLTKKLLSPGLRIILPSLFCLPCFTGHRYKALHRRDGKNLTGVAAREQRHTNKNGSPAFRRTVSLDHMP